MTCSVFFTATMFACGQLTMPFVYERGDYYELPAIISLSAQAIRLPEGLVHAVIKTESNYETNLTGKAGEIGLMQIKCSTTRLLSFTGQCSELYRPDLNLFYGLRYLARAYELCGGYADPPHPQAQTCAAVRYNRGVRTKNIQLNPYAYKVQQWINQPPNDSPNPKAALARSR